MVYVLYLFQIRFYDVITELSKLPKLYELSINIGWTNPANHLENIAMSPKMLTVKRLLLKDYTLLPADEFIHHFPRIFPHLVYLQLESLSNRFLETVANANVYGLFRHLTTYVPVAERVHNQANRNKVLYAYAGRHERIFQAHMYDELPSVDVPENDHDEILDVIYSEGEGDDGDMIAAVFA